MKAVRWAVFPFNSSLITNGHHRDLNYRLTQEMVRLFKGVTKIIRNHMQHEHEYINQMPDFSSLEEGQSIGSGNNPNQRRQIKITQLKQGSIAYSEYKEYCHLI